MNLTDFYREAIEELKHQAQRHEDLGEFEEWTAALDAAEKMEAWLMQGMSAPLDVDLAAFGIKLPEEEPQAYEYTLTGPASEDEDVVSPPVSFEADVVQEDASPSSGETKDAESFEVISEKLVLVEEPSESQVSEDALPEKDLTADLQPEPEELPDELLEEETPEQQQIRREVRLLREDIESGRFSQAVGRGHALKSRPEITPELKEQVEALLERAIQELNKEIASWLAKGDQALEAGDEEIAREAYNTVLRELDPDHEYARSALFKLDRVASAQLTEAQLRRLRAGLQERKNIRQLGEAVYQAEALRAEGQLPDELVELLGNARPVYDQLRQQHGQETTAMRYDDLHGRRLAVDSIRKRVMADEKEIFDPIINKFRPSVEVLAEATELLEQHSNATAQYEIDRVRAALPAYPLWARERLDKALEQPFSEHHARKLETLRLEVDQWAEKKRQAEGLLAQAEASSDPLEKLGYVLRAEKAFPYLEGLESKEDELAPLVVQALQTAGNWLASRMVFNRDQARLHLSLGEYAEARQRLVEAENDLHRWPPVSKPENILALEVEYVALHREIDTDETNYKEFTRQAAEIRRLALSPDTRAAGMDLYRQVRSDERYQKYSELRVLTSEMDQYADIGDLLRELDDVYKIQDWGRVQELATKIKATGKAGQFAGHVDDLLAEADLEIEIARAKDFLENDEVVKANAILDKRIRTEPSQAKRAALEERLKPERDKIRQCIQNNKEFQPLYDRAYQLSQKRGIAERLLALRLFRYVGGSEVPDPDTDWPEYKLSLRTTDARREARRVADGLRQDLLPGLILAYQRREKVSGDELATQARSLRQAGLLESEEERAAARWAEVTWESQRARSKENLGDWDSAVQIWSELDRLYPFLPEVERGLHRARIQQVISQAEGLLINDQGEQALALLRSAQQEPSLGRSWQIALTLADVHSRRGDFVQAYRSLSDAERLVELQGEVPDGDTTPAKNRELLAKKRKEIEREKEIQEIIARSKNEWQSEASNAREALRLLQSALNKPPTNDSRRLRELRDQIYTKSEESLLKTARLEKAKGTDDGKIQAVAALVDLRELENIVKRPEKERRSAAELDSLRAELAPAARAVMEKAKDFDPANLPLQQALSEADILMGRLQSFASVIPLFKEELSDAQENLEKRRNEVTKFYERLHRLQTLLEEANHSNLWEDALRSDNFDLLEQYYRQIQYLDLGGMLEVQGYGMRIQEWKELHMRLTQEIAKVKRIFEVDENFEAVVMNIRRARVRYDVRLDNQPWRQVGQKEYEKIFYTIGNKLVIADIHGSAQKPYLQGWDEVEQAAIERGEELSAWEAWRARVEQVGSQVYNCQEKVAQHSTNTPLKAQIRNWQDLEDQLTRLHELLGAGPQQDGALVGTHSLKTKNYEKKRKTDLQDAYIQILDAQREIAKLQPEIEGPGKGFPRPAEFDDAVKRKDAAALEKLIQRAKTVGATSPREEGLIKMYENILLQWRNHPGKDENHQGNGRKRKWPWQRE